MKKLLAIILLFIISSLQLQAQDNQTADWYYKKAEDFKTAAATDSALYYYSIASKKYKEVKANEQYVNSLNQIATMLTRGGKYEPAMQYLQEALSVAKSNLSINSLSVANIYFTMAVTFSGQKNFTKSIENHQKALQMRIDKTGEFTTDIASSYGNIGNVYFNNKEYDQAIEAHTKALQIREKLNGPQSLELVQSYTNLGNALRDKGDLIASLANFEKGLNIRQIKLGAAHKDLAKSYKNISEVYYLLKNTALGDSFKKKAEDLLSSQN